MTIRMTKTTRLSQLEIRQRLRAAYDAILETDAADTRQSEPATPAHSQLTEANQPKGV